TGFDSTTYPTISGTVTSVTVSIIARGSSSSQCKAQLNLIDGASTSLGTTAETSTFGQTYSTYTMTLSTNVTNPTFKTKLILNNYSSGAAGQCYYSSIWMVATTGTQWTDLAETYGWYLYPDFGNPVCTPGSTSPQSPITE